MNHTLNVLVVDDDMIDRRATARALMADETPVQVTEATTCAAALSQLAGPMPPDIVLLDFHLPDGDGLDLLREMSSRNLTIPVIMLTGHGDERMAVDLMKAGASDYLPKSDMTSERLWRSLRSVLRLHQAQAEAAAERRAREDLLRAGEERLRQLYDITSVPDLTFEDKLDRLLEEGRRQLGMETALLARVEGDRYEIVRSFPAGTALPVGFTCRLGETFCELTLRRKEAFVVEHAAELEWRDHPAHTHFEVEAYVGTVVWSGGRKWGNLAFNSTEPHPVEFTRGDQEYVRLMAQWIGGELDRLEAEAELRRSEERYRSLVEATAQIVWTTSANGELITEQPQWGAFTGQSMAQYQGWGWLTAVHPEDQWQTAQAWMDAVNSRHLYSIEHRLRRYDGVYRHFIARAAGVFNEDGSLREWVGVHTDITERKEAEARLRFLAEANTALSASLDYEQTLGQVAHLAVEFFSDWCAVDLQSDDGTIRRLATVHLDPSVAQERNERRRVDLNPSPGASGAIRTGCPELVSEITDDWLIANLQYPEELRPARALGLRSYISVPLVAHGRVLGAISLMTAQSGRRFVDADLELAEELARRAALAVDNARLYHETRARVEREALVNKIGRTLRGSLNPEVILEVATREVGQALCVNCCNLATLSPQREAFEIAPQQYVAGDGPRLASVYPLALFPPELLAQWKAGRSIAISDTETDPDAFFLRQIPKSVNRVRAFLACPVFLRGEWAGLFAVLQTDGPRDWTSDEVALMTAIADMLTLALENARLYLREHHVADMLQAAFLPDLPDSLRGLDLAKSYRSGLEEAQVGGDLYDAFALSDGRVALVIADVSGKGLGAAVQTATVKYSLRAFAAEAASPALVLRRLNRTLRADVSGLGEHFVTLFYAVFDPRMGRLTYAGAGHETQIIKRAAGGITELHANGPILGIAEHRYGQEVDYLHPGDSLILFTDGLTEARAVGTRELLDLERVAKAVDDLDTHCGPGAIVSYLENLALEWTAGRPQDDLALLVARRVPFAAEPAAGMNLSLDGLHAPPAAAEEALFGFTFPASADYAAEVRQAVAHWMEMLGYDRPEIDDLQTAVTEAVTNAVRHGSPNGSADTFQICGYRHPDETFAVEVADQGPGFTLPAFGPIMPLPDADGGRGLPLMYALADEVALLPSETGLRLRLTKKRPILADTSA